MSEVRPFGVGSEAVSEVSCFLACEVRPLPSWMALRMACLDWTFHYLPAQVIKSATLFPGSSERLNHQLSTI